MPRDLFDRDWAEPRHDWTLEEVEALFDLPFTELVFKAAEVHRRWFDPAEVQRSQLLSVDDSAPARECAGASSYSGDHQCLTLITRIVSLKR